MKVASWNIARGLSDDGRVSDVHEGIKRLDADLIFLPEAFDQAGQPSDSTLYMQLGYDDCEPHPSNQQYILALSRIGCNAEVLRLSGRNTIKVTTAIQGETTEITGAHFDDRNEAFRLEMAKAFITHSNSHIPSALIGDLNSMHGKDFKARILSSDAARALANKINHQRIRSLATRLTDMASGDTIETLETAGYVDVDQSHRSTMLMAGFAIAQLDHLMLNGLLRVGNFESVKLRGSDHKAIVADVRLA